MKIKKIFLVSIIILAFILRFYKLGVVPPALEWDEVAIGYDAYSILKTGRDQFGQILPITFRSIDDYKPPLYEYLAIPSIALFGLNEFSVRFPSALAGVVAVLLTYFLVKEIFLKWEVGSGKWDKEVRRGSSRSRKSKDQKIPPQYLTSYLPLLTSFFLAISPWHLQFSRAAFEVNLSVTLLIGAVLSFLLSFKRKVFFLLSSFLFGLGFFTYHSARVVFPLLFLFLLFNFRKKIVKGKYFRLGLGVYLFLVLAFLPIMFSKTAQMRFRVTNISSNLFLQYDTQEKIKKDLIVDQKAESGPYFRFFHGRRVILLTTLIDNYFSHFNYDFLFQKADVVLHHAPDFGLLYRWDTVFLLIGFIVYFAKFISQKNLVLPLWFFLAPLPAAVTLQVPHAVRTELFLPTFQIFTALGFLATAEFVVRKVKKLLVPFLAIALLFLILNFSIYIHQYYVHLPFEYGKFWLDGRKEAVAFTEAIKDNYQKVVVSTKLEMPHLFWLFYSQHDPCQYLQEGGTVSGGWAEEGNKFDNYQFRQFDYRQERTSEGRLFVGTPEEFPSDAKIVKTIYYLDGEKAIVIAKS